MLNSLYTNENLTTVVLKFFKVGANGLATNFSTITLTNANISEVDQSVEKPATGAATDRPYIVKLSLTYQKIQIASNVGNITAQDDWQAPTN
ncbi:MAG: type VI secretion system tube protein Hcp [Sphingobacteriales bacterium]